MKQVNFKARFRDLQNRLVFFRFVGDQKQTSARPAFAGTLNHEHRNVYSPRAFETLIHENVTYIVFFVVCKIYFLLVLSKCSIRSKTMCQNVQGLRHLYGNNHRTKNSRGKRNS